ncbi:TraR/DksA family transcriptional regulator [Isoalcanivorax indicus]|uniref:TraR/DksA family transcriptional regulator n=1 Tax=Isoalcanivorax indicus TaxID=2202653 RepID=UPI000DBA5412|nr:TraR/DksA family transcriptional regulator [Isoalcanivorax indicus]
MKFEPLRKLLLERQAMLEQIDADSSSARKPVELDQQSVGRLSRMDALQQQAMSVSSTARRRHEIRAIRAALTRLDNNDYGYCEDCGCVIQEKRLALYPTVTLCVGCAEAREEG